MSNLDLIPKKINVYHLQQKKVMYHQQIVLYFIEDRLVGHLCKLKITEALRLSLVAHLPRNVSRMKKDHLKQLYFFFLLKNQSK